MQRLIQKIKPDKWDALEEIDKRFDEVEAKYKFPPKSRYRAMVCELSTDTLIIERVWKSMAKLEEGMLNAFGDPDEQAHNAELNEIVEEQWNEIYLVWPLKI